LDGGRGGDDIVLVAGGGELGVGEITSLQLAIRLERSLLSFLDILGIRDLREGQVRLLSGIIFNESISEATTAWLVGLTRVVIRNENHIGG
jgi:hypothetical protein